MHQQGADAINLLCWLDHSTDIRQHSVRGQYRFFLTIGNVAFVIIASHFLIKLRKDRETDRNRSGTKASRK